MLQFEELKLALEDLQPDLKDLKDIQRNEINPKF